MLYQKRRTVRQRKITVNYLHQKENKDKWLPARSPCVRQKRKMLALAISYGVYTALSNHTYCVGDQVYHQMAGGPIGLQLTGAVSRPYMMRWDTLCNKKVLKYCFKRDTLMTQTSQQLSNSQLLYLILRNKRLLLMKLLHLMMKHTSGIFSTGHLVFLTAN